MESASQQGKRNPRETANPLSVLSFWWTVALFKLGYTKDLTEEDLCSPLEEDKSQILGDMLERQWERQIDLSKRKKKKPSLKIALLRTFAWEYTHLGVMSIVTEVFRLGQPLLLGKLLSYFRPDTDLTRQEAFLYAAGMVGCSAVLSFIMNHYTLGSFHVGMRVRAACCSLIYRKSLRLSRTALGDTAAGKVVNLLSNDVSRFDMVSIFLHFMWSAPLTAFFIAYLLYLDAGVAGFVGIAVVFTVVPLQAYTGKLSSIFRRQMAYKTDERVRLMDEIVSGIQVIKMYAWEKPFAKLIALARRLEIKVVKKTSIVRGLYMTFMMCTTRIALFSTLVCYVLLGNKLTAERVFVIASYFNILSHTMTGMFIRGFAEIAETLVSIRRLEDFLVHDEFKQPTRAVANGGSVPPDEAPASKAPVVLRGVTARWTSESDNDTLVGVDLVAEQGMLIAVVGQVGAGKSSLLQVILGELPVTSGTCTVNGKVSYACQESWVFSASIRQNITFGMPFDKRRYSEVVRVCALERDFAQFPEGDMTVVGERGSSLSGGQKARVNLARAVYNDADIYLLDDPLSAVDTHVGKHLFDECIAGYLKNKTRILVTHQLQYLRDADLVLVINNGVIEMQGSFSDLMNTQEKYTHLLVEEEEDSQPEGERPDTPIKQLIRQISIQSKTSSSKDVSSEHEVNTANPDLAEQSSKGKYEGSVLVAYFRAGTNVCALSVVFLMFLLTQIVASGADYWVSYWTVQEELRTFYENHNVTAGWNATEPHDPSELLSTDTYMYIYGGFVVGLFVIALTRSLAFVSICMSCSEWLHSRMFNSIIRTRMRFFNINPSGRILNRFSKDIGCIDEYLPKALLDATQMLMMMFGALIIATTVNYLFLVPIFVMGGIFLFVRRIYLKTSKNVKRLEGVAKSPVFTHLNATLQGLTTIRAYGAQDILRKEFDRHQDRHSSAWYMFVSTATAFGFSLDILCIIFITLVTFSFLVLDQETFGGMVGLAITQSMALAGMMQWGVRQSAEVANQMMSVERVLEYSVLEEEPNLEATPDNHPPKGWPTEGRIEFEHTYMRYFEEGEPVLKDLNIMIMPTEKVGIVGRTGAGKSSLITALFRLAYVEGSIKIDGVDTHEIALQDLRSKISIIPQDPVLFSGTLRRNLDPFEEFPDNVLWRALEEVELRETLGDANGLDARVAEGGSNFSVGQRQLVCLARAILRNNKILMMDEATANVDPHTDSLIQKTIRLKFNDCTVLTVAHRLNTIMDSDKVLVMEGGREVEFDHPHILLRNKDGYFHNMLEETGRAMADQLSKVAEENYQCKKIS